MVVVQLSGGLGNQMFEYALYLKLKSLGRKVKIDDFTCYGPGQRTKQLDVFGLSWERASREEYEKLTDSSMRPADRLRRKLTGRRDLSYRERDSNFDPEALRRDPAVLQGCFQSEKYFHGIENEVRDAFRFRNFRPDERMARYEEQIGSCRSVSVHIRRGDYLDPKYSGLYEGICDDAYYERAIGRMRELMPDAVFFFFSNDPGWVKERYHGVAYVTVEGNDEDAGYADLFLMSRCRYNIIANSSFSWWGAWLNENPEKRVIAPRKWLNGRDCRDIYTEEMILL